MSVKIRFSNSLGRNISLNLKLAKLILTTIGFPHLGTRVRLNLLLKSLAKIKAHPDMKILDCGCGYGYVDYILAKRGFHPIAVDSDPVRLSVAKSLIKEKTITFLKDSLYKLTFKDASFDICFCLDVLEHIKDDQKVLKELVRVTQKGGYLIISCPNFYANKIGYQHFGHIRPGYKLEKLSQRMSDLGFKLEGTFPYPKTVLGKFASTLDYKLQQISPFLSSVSFLLLYPLMLLDLKFPKTTSEWNYFLIYKKLS